MPSVEQIRALREQTGAGMMDCKRALAECAGNFGRATDWLREKGVTVAMAKSGRVAAEGLVAAATDGDVTGIAELNCETDFVAKNGRFVALAERTAELVAKNRPKNDDEALSLAMDGGKLGDKLTDSIAKLGENIHLRRVAVVEGGFRQTYIHNQMGNGAGRIAVVVKLDKDAVEVAEGVAMHIAAFTPLAISKDDLEESLVEKERRILRNQAERQVRDSKRPPEIIAKMIEGRLAKWFKEVVLLEQPYVMDDKKSVGEVLREAGVRVVEFVRWQVGGGKA